ncbi:unnamed protein product [Closterium sp. NIES-53]
MLYNYLQGKHVGGVDGIGAGILAHAVGMLAWWEVASPDRELWPQWEGKHMCVYPWEVPDGMSEAPLCRIIMQDYDFNHPDEDQPEFRLQWKTDRCPQRAMSEVVAASSHDTTTPRHSGGRGPSASRGRANAATANGNVAPGPVNATIAARATQQERHILSLNQTINRLEGRGNAAVRPEITRLTGARPRRARETTVDAPGATHAISILAYDTSVGVMNFWVTPEQAERCMARALRLSNTEHFVLLHMVWGVDDKRTGWFTRQMQVWRNTKWEQGRAFVNILHGLPYRTRANPRVRLPVRPSAQEVPRITRKEFTEQFKAGPGSWELMTWHRNAAGMPFATENFERAFCASFRRPIPPPLVVKTYVLAFWLFGVSINLWSWTALAFGGF